MIFGFLRETKESADKAGMDLVTGIPRTGLNEYLKVIFPEINDWIHDKVVEGGVCGKARPDYRSKTLKLIVEFDGIQHYQSPEQILRDIETTKMYEAAGYKVVRIPYFIQLTNKVVKRLFNTDVSVNLFDENIPSLRLGNPGTPSHLCPAGIERMANEFRLLSPEQYMVNVESLKKVDDSFLTGVDYLIKAYNDLV